MSFPSDIIEFVAFHKPAVLDGEYTLTVKQQVKIDEKFGWGNDQWTAAPSTKLQFAVAGPRFSLDPDVIQSQFPPPKSAGEYYSVLPHIILNRTTLPWERTIDNSLPSNTAQPTSWMALFCSTEADGGAPSVGSLRVKIFWPCTSVIRHPGNDPEFVKVSRGIPGQASTWRDETGSRPAPERSSDGDRCSEASLWKFCRASKSSAFLVHVRLGKDSTDSTKTAEYPVILCNRLPAAGTPARTSVHNQRFTLFRSRRASRCSMHSRLSRRAINPVRLLVLLVGLSQPCTVTRHSRLGQRSMVSRCTAHRSQRPTQPSAAQQVSSTRCACRPPGHNAERFLSQGYVPIKHQTRQGNHLVSWYRSPLLPGQSLPAELRFQFAHQMSLFVISVTPVCSTPHMRLPGNLGECSRYEAKRFRSLCLIGSAPMRNRSTRLRTLSHICRLRPTTAFLRVSRNR